MSESFDIAVILCTYNRCELLPQAIASILAQDCPQVRYELLVVDNHSTDRTREVCEAMLSPSPVPARYLFEPQQGVSFARNAAIAQARAPILAFFDDDVCVSRNWVATIKRAFAEHPDLAGLGGKVLPQGCGAFPEWLTRQHWMPLALQDYGDQAFRINAENPLGLVAANLALRREALKRTGLFSPVLQRVKNRIGSMEDHELHQRLWNAGLQEMYLPELVVTTAVQAERFSKSYHRQWHRGHGHFYALLRDADFERSAGRLFDVPAHLYKQACRDALAWCKERLTGDSSTAFERETRLWFFVGFLQNRLAAFRRSENGGLMREVMAFLSWLRQRHSDHKTRLEKP
ncbi:MAG: glycosyltransferase family 2 protein [Acidobacteria bacterium]|nr:glycosyltransferase family 2 protein [Acidobacteriota bacterium]